MQSGGDQKVQSGRDQEVQSGGDQRPGGDIMKRVQTNSIITF